MTFQFPLQKATPADKKPLETFLTQTSLSSFELLSPESNFWLVRDETGQIIASAGLEYGSGKAVLLRSVAVLPAYRKGGWGKHLTEYALETASRRGYKVAYLFSSSTGDFWQKMGFEEVSVTELVEALPDAPQVLRFIESGKIRRERAWRKSIQSSFS